MGEHLRRVHQRHVLGTPTPVLVREVVRPLDTLARAAFEVQSDAVQALNRERASRQAWAEEAMRMDMAEAARDCTGAHDCSADVHVEGCFYSNTAADEHAHQPANPLSPPQCSVHPEPPTLEELSLDPCPGVLPEDGTP